VAADFHAIHIPEAYGGAGGDAVAACIVIEEVARVCASSSLIPAVNKLGTVGMILAGSEELKQRYLPEVARGEAVGIVGPSGAGKSTLIQILLQLRTPTVGHYLINGEPAEDFDPADWHRRVAYVPQEPRLIHATVAENIRYLRDLDDSAVQRAARLARIHDDIVSWNHGYDTVVGPRADAVSGGQQQRLCLARALAARPEVLVLDEPTSALDPRSESLLQESLRSLIGEATMFIAAHRMSTLDMCGRVMVIVDGRLEAFDTVERLYRDNPYYRSASTLAVGAGADELI
jgi:ABC-type multidrug transport system fused ATPase/permease subunit